MEIKLIDTRQHPSMGRFLDLLTKNIKFASVYIKVEWVDYTIMFGLIFTDVPL